MSAGTGDVREIPQHERPWQPLTIDAVMHLFRDAPFPWWVAGGQAIELAVGEPIRSHDDVDVLILRRDHLAARELLAEWDCWVADPPGTLRSWPVGETLQEASHDIWCRETPEAPWRFQLMLDESDEGGTHWRSRRDPRITRPVADIGHRTGAGVPYLRPEIQLFYKAKGRRPKDEIDFSAALPLLGMAERGWLQDAITLTSGVEHPWLSGPAPEEQESTRFMQSRQVSREYQSP